MPQDKTEIRRTVPQQPNEPLQSPVTVTTDSNLSLEYRWKEFGRKVASLSNIMSRDVTMPLRDFQAWIDEVDTCKLVLENLKLDTACHIAINRNRTAVAGNTLSGSAERSGR